MKLLRAIGISLAFALFAPISGCEDESAGVRSNQNPPRQVPGSNLGFATNPQKSDLNTKSKNKDQSTTDAAPDGA